MTQKSRPSASRSSRRRPAARIRVLWQSGRRLATDRAIREAVKAAFDQAGKETPAIDVVLVDDRTLARIHGRFMGDPTPTDVIAFDLSDESDALRARAGGGGGVGAEIYASHQCARRVAAQRGVDPGRELALYVVHGALHLCGFDDHSARGRRRMRAAESMVLDGLGYAPDRGPHP